MQLERLPPTAFFCKKSRACNFFHVPAIFFLLCNFFDVPAIFLERPRFFSKTSSFFNGNRYVSYM
jgi:hypothetical protein